MENRTHIKLELGIDASKFIQMVQINNETIEKQLSTGIQLAINDLTENDNFVQTIREATKNELALIVNKAVMSYELKTKISKLIEQKIGEKVEQYADKIATQITSSLK